MKNSGPVAIIGGYDSIASSFFSNIKKNKNNQSIFININGKLIRRKSVFNYEVFQLKKILETLNTHNIKDLLFLGKINRPNISNFKNDGEIDKYIPQLVSSFKQGDGIVLMNVLNIFIEKGYNVLSPFEVSDSFFLNKDELNDKISEEVEKDKNKSIKILNDLSKYDNAQSIVVINGYIISIEAAEGTDNLLKRTISIRMKLNQLEKKAGLLTKIPKIEQSKLVDLPVIGVNTLKLLKKANLNGIAINPKLTIIHNKEKFIKLARSYDLNIYNVLQ